MGIVAASIITVTSITFSILLIAIEQAAATMTHQVVDQYLRRRLNQFYFGYFVGLATYALLILATVQPSFNPVFGGMLAVIFTIFALLLLITLVYTTLDRVRPTVIIEAIHDHILAARERQVSILRATRRQPEAPGRMLVPVKAEVHGFITRININALEGALWKRRRGKSYSRSRSGLS